MTHQTITYENKKDFLTNTSVKEFITWLQEKLPTLEVKLQILPSRFVPGGLKVDAEGVESVLEYYRWKSQWVDASGKQHISSSWNETKYSLDKLGQWLRNSISENNENCTLQACMEVLKWGGVYNQGSINFLGDLANKHELVNYLSQTRSALALNNADTTLLELEQIIKRYNSGLTKIHALASFDSLPIYDSRVGATICALSALFSNEVGKHCNSLIFSTSNARGIQSRNPGDFTGFKHPTHHQSCYFFINANFKLFTCNRW